MLHNILLKAGLSTEITKQGKFINVVLAAGEITARITMMDDKPFETALVGGMSFPIPVGFKSVSFSSESSQQLKVWLGFTPMDFTPPNINAGSASIVSEAVRVFYGQARELVPAVLGRAKVTLNPKEDIYVGGIGFDLNSEVKVSANEVFELNTQGAIYAYSKDTKNAKTSSTVVNENSVLLPNLTVAGFYGDKPYMADTVVDGVNSIYTVNTNGIYAITDNDDRLGTLVDSYVGTLVGGGGGGFGDVYRVISMSGNDLILTEINMIDKSKASTVIHTFVGTVAYPDMVRFNGDYACMRIHIDGVASIARLKLHVSCDILPEPTEVGGIYQMNILSDGTVAVNSNLYVQSWAYGNGSFDAVKPIGIPVANHNHVSVDEKTNYLYLTTNYDIFESRDLGGSWVSIYLNNNVNPLGVAVLSVGGHMMVATSEDFLVMDKDKNFVTVSAADNDGYGFNHRNFLFGKSGRIYSFWAGKVHVITGELVYGGGLPVAVMSELN